MLRPAIASTLLLEAEVSHQSRLDAAISWASGQVDAVRCSAAIAEYASSEDIKLDAGLVASVSTLRASVPAPLGFLRPLDMLHRVAREQAVARLVTGVSACDYEAHSGQ